MKTLKIILIALLILILLVVGLYWYVGGFYSVTIKKEIADGYFVAGKEFTGPYNKIMPTMNYVDSALRSKGINCTVGFGIYYDDPKVTPQENCRSFVGNVINKSDSTTLEVIKKLGLRSDSVANAPALIIEFPIRSSMSYMVGPMKVYPAFTKYLEENKLQGTFSMEVYDVPNKKILYIMQYK